MKEQCKNLIVNADDLGYSEKINQGIIRSIQNGIVTSVSLMANGNAFDHAVEFLKNNPTVSVGWHINLTAGKPLSAASKINTLVDKTGRFYSKRGFVSRTLLSRINPLHVQQELQAQYEKIQKTGLTISHIDSHHDIHCLPVVMNKINAYRESVRFIRFVNSGVLPWSYSPYSSALISLIQKVMVRKSYHFPRFFFTGYELLWKKSKIKVLQNLLKKLPDGKTVLFCHPGFFDEFNKEIKYNRQRELEVNALCHENIKKLISQNRINLVSFNNYYD